MKRIITFLILLVMLLTTACAKVGKKGSNAKIDVKLVNAIEKITQDEDISSFSEGTLCVSAAKGETEGSQFIVRSDDSIIGYEFEISELKNGKHVIDSSAVTIYTELYSYANYGTYNTSLPSGSYPDALIPAERIVDAGENQIEANKNQGFFVDFKIPEDAVAGTYTGKITMGFQKKSIEIPVELEVYDFTMNQAPSVKTCYLIWQDWLAFAEYDSTDDKYMDYYDTLLEYNICAYTFPHSTASEFVSYVREYYNQIPCFGIPYDAISTSANDWTKFTAYLSELAVASAEDGVNYFDKAYYYLDMFYDEYNMVEWRKEVMLSVLEKCDTVEESVINDLLTKKLISSPNCELAEDIRDLQHVIPGQGYDSSLTQYDVTHCSYDFYGSYATYQTLVDATSSDKEFWYYNAFAGICYPAADKTINGYLISARDLYWDYYKHDIVGDLWWCVNGYCNWNNFTDGSYAPITEVYTTACHDGVSNGDGYLLYPGFGYGSDKPFGSLRLTAIRDGIDDNTYMQMLGERYENLTRAYGANTYDAKALVSLMNETIISNRYSNLESGKLLDSRDVLANAIELADKQGVLFNKLSLEENDLEFVIYTDANTELAINGTSVDYVEAGEGRVYSGTTQLSASQKLCLEFTQNGKTEKIELHTKKSGSITRDFEQAEDIADCIMYSKYGAAISLNTDSAYAISGNSAAASFTGYDFGNAENNSDFTHKLGFPISATNKKLSNIESIEFWVYNPQSKDVQITLYFSGTTDGVPVRTTYDEIILRAKSWQKISIDNFKYLTRDAASRDTAVLDKYTEFGLELPNQIGTTTKLYIDNLFIR